MNPCVSPFFCSWTSVWRCSEISCSKVFRTRRKHPWWDLFSQVESSKFENYIKVDSFTDIFVETYRNLHMEQPFRKKTYRWRFQVLSTHQHPHKYVLDLLVHSKWLRSLKYFNYNLPLTEILKIIKHHLVKTTFK